MAEDIMVVGFCIFDTCADDVSSQVIQGELFSSHANPSLLPDITPSSMYRLVRMILGS